MKNIHACEREHPVARNSNLPSTISFTRVAEICFRRPSQFLARFGSISQQSRNLCRTKIARINRNDDIALVVKRRLIYSSPLPVEDEYRETLPRAKQNREHCIARQLRSHSHALLFAAASSIASQRSRGRVPNPATNQDFQDRAAVASPTLIRARARVILRVTNVSPRSGDS